jgi:hypothetical protein
MVTGGGAARLLTVAKSRCHANRWILGLRPRVTLGANRKHLTALESHFTEFLFTLPAPSFKLSEMTVDDLDVRH